MTKDGGKSLTLDELEQVAKDLEYLTAKRFPTVVGGLPQIAIITDGKAEVTKTEFDVDHEPPPIPTIMNRISAPEFSGATYGMIVKGPGAQFVEDGNISDVKHQDLDHIFFFRTKFTRCVLYYNGTSNFIFDKSNSVIDSKLVVAAGIDLKSPGIEQIRANFPDLPIEDLTGKPLIPRGLDTSASPEKAYSSGTVLCECSPRGQGWPGATAAIFWTRSTSGATPVAPVGGSCSHCAPPDSNT